jgi:hypothetical protein
MQSNNQQHVEGGIANDEHVLYKIRNGSVIIIQNEHIGLGFSVHLPCSVNNHISS